MTTSRLRKTVLKQQQEIERLQKRNALLEDVAVAAEYVFDEMPGEHEWCGKPHKCRACKALDKLREVGND